MIIYRNDTRTLAVTLTAHEAQASLDGEVVFGHAMNLFDTPRVEDEEDGGCIIKKHADIDPEDLTVYDTSELWICEDEYDDPQAEVLERDLKIARSTGELHRWDWNTIADFKTGSFLANHLAGGPVSIDYENGTWTPYLTPLKTAVPCTVSFTTPDDLQYWICSVLTDTSIITDALDCEALVKALEEDLAGVTITRDEDSYVMRHAGSRYTTGDNAGLVSFACKMHEHQAAI